MDKIIVPCQRFTDPESKTPLYLSEKITDGLPFGMICPMSYPHAGDIFNQNKPIVLISGATAYHPKSAKPAVFIYDTYASAVISAGAIPLLALTASKHAEPEIAEAYADACDCLLLPGLSHFAENETLIQQLRDNEDPKKYSLDKRLYEAFCKRNKTVFGICLGLQMINVWEGGTLSHHFMKKSGVEHMLVSHMIHIREGSFLSEIFGENIRVNSRHHDCINVLAPDFLIDALSLDAVIEAISHKNKPVYAVQWHPERCRGQYREPFDGADMAELFRIVI